jgi:hypothetical protein
MPTDDAKSALDPKALTLADAAALLTRASGQQITIAWLEADRAAGAPANADGTLNLVHLAAWLVRETNGRD